MTTSPSWPPVAPANGRVNPGVAKAFRARRPAGDDRLRLHGPASRTDGLVEHHKHALDERLATLARLATQHADQPPERLCHALIDDHPGDGSDDIAILALRLPPGRTQ